MASPRKPARRTSRVRVVPKAQPAEKAPPNPDELFEARIWTMRQEGRSLEEIAAKLGVNRRTVSRVLSDDPERLLGIINDEKTARLRRFEDTENIAMQAIVRTISASQAVFFAPKTPGAKPGDVGNALDPMMVEQFLEKGAGWGSFYAKVAADASLRVNNLRGYGSTPSKPAGGSAQAQGGASAAAQAIAAELGTGGMTPMRTEADVIEECIKEKRLDILPPEMQETAIAIMGRRAARDARDRESPKRAG